MSLSVWIDHLPPTRGGARMEDSGASSSTITIGRPQWRHTKVGGFASGSSFAAASPAMAAVALACTPSNCRLCAGFAVRFGHRTG